MMSQTKVTMSLLGALLLGASACAPADGQSDFDAVSAPSADLKLAVQEGRIADQSTSAQTAMMIDADAISNYEASVAAKAEAAPGQAFYVEEHMPSLRTKAPAVPSKSFELRAELPKSDYVMGEPVILQVSLTNVTDQPLDVAPVLDVVFDHFKVEVTTPDGLTLPFVSMIQACTTPKAALRTFEPGETFTNDVKIFAPKGGWLFDQEGDYSVSVRLNGMTPDTRLIQSESIDLTVLKGTASEQAAASLIMDGQAALLMDYREGDQYDRGQADLKRVLQNHPDSIHALYAGHVLGNMAGSEFMTIKGPRAADYDLAVSYLEPVFGKLMDRSTTVAPDMVASVSTKLAESYLAKGMDKQARQTLQTFLSTFGSDPMMKRGLEDARAMLTEL